METAKQDRTIGIVTTIIFHGLLLYALLSWGFQRQIPPPGEQGILISFGDSETGKGADEPMLAAAAQPRPQPSADREEQENLTQDFEDAPAIQPKKKKPKPQQRPKPTQATESQPAEQPIQKPEEKPREVNRNALFPGQGAVASAGQGDNGQGNQGTPDGSTDGIGTVGGGLGTSGANLSGRSLNGKLPEPDYRVQQSGKIVVRIKVDRDGNVMEAKAEQKGSTLWDATLCAAAESAALRARFNASASSPITQWGTITYVFKLGQ